MTLVLHPAYRHDDFMIERLKRDADIIIIDARMPGPLYAYLLPDNWEGHPSDAAIKYMKGK
jgi:hypothetical protein